MNEATNTVVPAPQEIKLTPAQEARFWAKVNKAGPTMPHMESPCWVWTASGDRKGYGQIRIGGKLLQSHRVAWTLGNGPIPRGLCVCHHCDRPNCCRAEHFFLGTATDNMRDMASKRRHGSQTKPGRLARGDKHYARTHPDRLVRGERQGGAKLTASKITEIRSLYAAGGISFRRLGAQFAVTKTQISRIVFRKSWKHIP